MAFVHCLLRLLHMWKLLSEELTVSLHRTTSSTVANKYVSLPP